MKYLLSILLLTAVLANISAQNISLAMNYAEQGEYEKAKSIYQKLYEQNPNNQDYLLGLADTYIQLNEFKKAEKLLYNYIKKPTKSPNIMVELGYVFQIQKDSVNANIWYEKAIDIVKTRNVYAYTIGQAFQKHNLLERAIQTYEIANEKEPRINYSIQLARLYGEKGNQKKMFENYIKLIEENEKYIEVIQRNFNAYINDNPQNESNIILKRLLIQKLQNSPNILYNQILSWLFVQEQDFNKAFAQEKAIFKRNTTPDFSRLMDLAQIAFENKKYNSAFDINAFVINQSQDISIQIKAIENQMQIKLIQNNNPKDIEKSFLSHFNTYGYGLETLNLQLLYAKFLAFDQNQPDKALSNLEVVSKKNLNKFQQAKIQMLMADILVAQQQYNQALIKYSLISKMVKNTPLAQKSRYKSAQTSYYKGDFNWALTQFNILKKATTQTIANDALEMSRFIKQGKSETDSTQQALKALAKTDLLIYQNKPKLALNQLDSILVSNESYHIKDQALFKKAEILNQLHRYQEAVKYYQQLIDEHPKSIVTDNALFQISKIQFEKLNQPEEAMKNLETLIFNHQDSIFFVEARTLYRKLRGDQNIQ
ncbi:tetratricopeptide repeat protein [Flavobacterium sp. CS20]|uniref:tetratricopeptide repeat protein n=1 Tax=Flavobacterium sp. CS20 TaxID=2775246 RepID=UPI001B3A736F|nr:tetratricopeptide repeat protein [Flavobacterium sp. CS20]QTY26658.1 tetratricopeptide repeat protein [Flavobacterium sp. CS20]